MNDKGLVLCAASMLGLGVWRYWLAAQGGIRRTGSVAVWLLVGAAGVAAIASRYLLHAATAAAAAATPAERATVLGARLAEAMTASAVAMVCLAAGAVVLAVFTFVQRRRDACG